jgi:hypothetical protein
MAELLRLDLLTTKEALDGRAASCDKRRGDVLALETKTQREVLVGSGFNEQKRMPIPCLSRSRRGQGAGYTDWLP